MEEKRRLRRRVNQNLGRAYCWATCVETGEPCVESSEPGSNLPYCRRHRVEGDGAVRVIDHPTNKGIGKICVARFDLPKGYKMVYWGKRVRWRGCKGQDRAMSFLQNGGGIDPYDCEGQQLQYMACPGPGERSNTKCTDVCFGKTYDEKLIGREFETIEPVKKDHQLTQWYGSKDWFEARDIPRTNVGTDEYPAPQKKKRKTQKASKQSQDEGDKSGEADNLKEIDVNTAIELDVKKTMLQTVPGKDPPLTQSGPKLAPYESFAD
uniref:SET domain-containing protein n=1 Tax=Chloropicon primus TaxID=1764295 RepID=A0A7S2SWN3_9CHLO|mmetsp:Transcript_10341/g.29290  ORF Transcript_10341/g.29290 Transcript_10341/m.29290 type:complete len:265 (+) Transcript_10341:241-1035(+)